MALQPSGGGNGERRDHSPRGEWGPNPLQSDGMRAVVVGNGAIGRRKEFILQMGEGVAVSIPGFVIAKVDLYQVDSG